MTKEKNIRVLLPRKLMREPTNISKPNVDASFVFDTCQAAVGAVIRNDQGAVVLAMFDHLCPYNNTEKHMHLIVHVTYRDEANLSGRDTQSTRHRGHGCPSARAALQLMAV